MNLRRIRHFVALAETLNFRRAAERLHMAQPPLSVSIQKLEAELGVQLFDRESGGVRLTPTGRTVLAEARKLLFHGDQLREVARQAGEGTGGSLRIGFVGTATFGPLQRLHVVLLAGGEVAEERDRGEGTDRGLGHVQRRKPARFAGHAVHAIRVGVGNHVYGNCLRNAFRIGGQISQRLIR